MKPGDPLDYLLTLPSPIVIQIYSAALAGKGMNSKGSDP